MKLTLRARFAAICILLVMVSMIAVSAVWYLGMRAVSDGSRDIAVERIDQNAEESLRYRGTAVIRLLSAHLANALYFYDLYEIQALITAVMKEPDVEYVLVYDADGAIVHDGKPTIPTFGQVMDDGLAPAIIGADDLLIQRTDAIIDVSVPVYVADTRVGGVRIGLSMERVSKESNQTERALVAAYNAEVERRIGTVIVMLLLISLGGTGLAIYVARNLVKPIKHLVSYTSRIEQGDYRSDADTGRSDEIGDLMRAFDRMSESVRRNTLEIRHIAYHDSLSGLPNRLMFREFLEQRLSEPHEPGQRIALLFLDLDDFKRVNDTLGHDHGDQLLVAFAERLRLCVMDPQVRPATEENETTRMVARLGGDEFTVMLIGEHAKEHARRLAELILDAVKMPFKIKDREFFVSTSIGITLFPDDGQSADLLVKNADIAMYGAKIGGKNRYQYFHEKMLADADKRMELESQLRVAVSERQFTVFYQPIVSLPDQDIVGAEALIRWKHPERGYIPPAVFIPIAEELGLIDQIGDLVLDQACEDVVQWPKLGGRDLYVSVNLSSRQIRSDRIVATIEATMKRHGVAPEQLSLELTESSLLESEEAASTVLQALRRRGLGVWLDDFGTGFSGLSHLRQIPVDGVKIDRSFVADILRDPDDLALTSAIIAMGLSLNMKVTAEGVENDGQIELLEEHGCSLAQGYYFGRPMCAADWLEHLTQARLTKTRST